MKYTITILAILLLASCKKEYTCQCTDKDGHEVSTSNYKSSKKDLSNYETLCTAQAAGYNLDYPDKAPISCDLN